jgi:hypothetical protein
LCGITIFYGYGTEPFGPGFFHAINLYLSATEFRKRILDFSTIDKAIFFYEFIFVKTEAQHDEN